MTPQELNDAYLERLCLYREARSESLQAKVAVLAVIHNRTKDKKNRWPKTIAQVVTKPWHFSSFNSNDPGVSVWPNPKLTIDWQAWVDCCTVADTFATLGADPTNGANHYFDSSIDPPAVAWLGKGKTVADLMKFHTITIGKLSFFNIP